MDPKAITRPAKGLDIRSLKDFKNLGSLKSIFCAKEISKPKILLGLLILLVFANGRSVIQILLSGDHNKLTI